MCSTDPKSVHKNVFAYVDGFNLYHQVLEFEPKLKWLCLRTLISKFILPNNQLDSIKYFTAKVDPKEPKETAKQRRQMAYWEALQGKDIEVIPGRLEPRKRICKATCQGSYFTMSEKMSDVSLALNIYRDFLREKPGIMCVMTADLDVVPALEMVRQEDPKRSILLVIPTFEEKVLWSRSDDFKFVRRIKLEREWLEKSQLTNPAISKSGSSIPRPDNWS